VTSTHRVGGQVIAFGDNVNTDVIIPGRYLVSIDPAELAEHAFEPLGPETQQRLRASDVVVAGRNFGCGSAREQAAINTGLVAVECPAAVAAVKEDGAGDRLFVDYDAGEIEVNGETFAFAPYPQGLRDILEDGGLIPHLMRQNANGGAK
jgi:3-isopropylmalate/(R)-2-methylmalate dehydratase small subunit